jgi:SsrA-binding protein
MSKRKGGKRKAAAGDVATNRQASHRYNLLERWEAGIQLQGSEVKSLREGGVQLKDAYAALRDGEVWLHNMHVAPYGPASRENHEPERPRKLLLHRREIERLIGKTAEKGLTLVPTRVYFKGPHAKVEIALARGKDFADKRRALRDRDQRREIDRALREHGATRG